MSTGEEDEADYVPDEDEDSIDDEATLEEQEALENDGETADELAELEKVWFGFLVFIKLEGLGFFWK